MSTVTSDPRIIGVEVTKDAIVARLADGRAISVPLAWSWRLLNATVKQRKRYEIIGDGDGVHWPDIDEDISVRGMLHGMPACQPNEAKAKRKRKPTQTVVGRAAKGG
jgi:hypothetical protein